MAVPRYDGGNNPCEAWVFGERTSTGQPLRVRGGGQGVSCPRDRLEAAEPTTMSLQVPNVLGLAALSAPG